MTSVFDVHFLLEHRAVLLGSAAITVLLSIAAVLVSFVSGFVGWRLRESRRPLPRIAGRAYVEVMRNTPVLAFIYIAYFSFTDFGINLPAAACAILALGLQSGAYNAEILRGAYRSVGEGQRMAARALGLRHWQCLILVEVPQMMRVAFPALGNQIVATILGTSLASVIAVPELTYQSQIIGDITYRYFTIFAIDAVLYVLMVQLFIFGWGRFERAWLGRWSVARS